MKMEAQSTENVFETFLNVCGACKENLQSKDAKLLPCLHTFCKPCLLELSDGAKIRCSTCFSECTLGAVMQNLFVNSGGVPAAESVSLPNERKTCTACDEQVDATSFCQECAEWLCDQCVQAHRRVRVTKDHTILPKDSNVNQEHQEEARSSSLSDKLPFCPIHKQEVLCLFCETCDKLTCRDCQLLEHKEHRYQFVGEAAIHYKQFLSTLLSKLKEKRTYIENAKTLINRRYQEIAEREKLVTNDIKTFAVRLITEINKRGKKLLLDLNSVCSAKKRQLGLKHSEILALSGRLDHALKFAGYVMEHNSNSAVLDSKKVLINQLKHVLRTRCEVPNPYHVVDIRLKADTQFMLSNIPSQGNLIVDGVPYHGPNHGGPPTGQEQVPMTQLPPINPPTMPNQQGRRLPASLANFTPEQRAILMKKIAHMNRSQMSSTGSPNHPMRSATSTATSQQRHFSSAPQSSMVSSSNNPQQMATKMGMRLPTQQSGGMINLAQLQQQRLQRQLLQHQHHQHNPIVIAPTSPNSYPTPGTSTDGSSPYSRSDSGPTSSIGTILKPEVGERPSCSYASLNPKREARGGTGSPMLNLNMNDLNFDEDPESLSFLSSLKKEGSLTPDNDDIIPLEIVPVSESADSLHTPPPMAESSQGENDDVSITHMRPGSAANDTGSSQGNQGITGLDTFDDLGSDSLLIDMADVTPINDDPSEDYCACCHNGGDLLCCDFCPKVFHLLCHVPVLHASPSGTWRCGLCQNEKSFILETPPAREEDNAPVGSKRKLPVGLSDKELRSCERVLLELFCHEASVPFHEPVPKSVPSYYKIIATPMDFMTIRNKLTRQHFNHYKSVEDFVADVKRVFINCRLYNDPTSEVGQAGKMVDTFFDQLMNKYLPYVNVAEATPQYEQAAERAKKRSKKEHGPSRKSPSSKGRKSPGINKEKGHSKSRKSDSKAIEVSSSGAHADDIGDKVVDISESSSDASQKSESPTLPPRPQSADATTGRESNAPQEKRRRASHESRSVPEGERFNIDDDRSSIPELPEIAESDPMDIYPDPDTAANKSLNTNTATESTPDTGATESKTPSEKGETEQSDTAENSKGDKDSEKSTTGD